MSKFANLTKICPYTGRVPVTKNLHRFCCEFFGFAHLEYRYRLAARRQKKKAWYKQEYCHAWSGGLEQSKPPLFVVPLFSHKHLHPAVLVAAGGVEIAHADMGEIRVKDIGAVSG